MTRTWRIILTSALCLLALTICGRKRIEFEYYTWNLSAEEPATRDSNALHIVEMGDYAVPLLIQKLDHPFIFETDYEVWCLQEITRVQVSYLTTEDGVRFWKEWWQVNSSNY